MSVLPFEREAPNDPQWAHGEAFCIACGHTWEAVAPTGAVVLECQECHAMKGHWKFEFKPPATTTVWECHCGNQLFYMTPEGHMCANCGVYQRY